MFKTPQDLSTFLKMHSDVFHVQSNLVTLISAAPQTSPLISAAPGTSPTKSRSKANNQTSTNPQLCSPSHQNNSSNNNNVISLSSNVISLSNVNNNAEHQSVCLPPPATSLQNQTLKQRINSLVMKTIAHNTERDRSYAAASLANSISTAGGATGSDAWKAKVLQNTKVIISVLDSLKVSEALFSKCLPSDITR
jgi:exonuclease 3'-5' domain-containing protein 1